MTTEATFIPICYPSDFPFVKQIGPFFIFLNLELFIVGLMYSFYQDKKDNFIAFITIYVKILAVIIYPLSIIIGDERPNLDCIPSFMLAYGMPSPEIVMVTSTSTSILLYLIQSSYFITNEEMKILENTAMKKEDSKKNGGKTDDVDHKDWVILKAFLTSCGWIINGICVITVITVLIAYPLMIYLMSINSLSQVIVSIAIGIGTSIVCGSFFCYRKIRIGIMKFRRKKSAFNR
ncbi:MAG: hypothetical protein ACTSUE_20420 [Promethearchaeota archaeon]